MPTGCCSCRPTPSTTPPSLHRAAVAAAVAARVGHVIYTSITAADTNGIVLADAHRPTEQAILASGLPYTFLRNDWYLENDLGTIAGALATGTLATSSRGGRFAPAPREDYARAAATVLATDGHEGVTYELGASASSSYADWAKALSNRDGPAHRVRRGERGSGPRRPHSSRATGSAGHHARQLLRRPGARRVRPAGRGTGPPVRPDARNPAGLRRSGGAAAT